MGCEATCRSRPGARIVFLNEDKKILVEDPLLACL